MKLWNRIGMMVVLSLLLGGCLVTSPITGNVYDVAPDCNMVSVTLVEEGDTTED